MRSVFTVKLDEGPDGNFPSDDDIVAALRGFGWEARSGPNWEYFCSLGAACAYGDRAGEEAERREWYREQADLVFAEMPEVLRTDPECDAVIYFGQMADQDTVFIATRRVMGELKFRLRHKELLKLQSSTDRLVKNVLAQELFCDIVGSRVTVYERGRNVVLLSGDIVTNRLREAYRRDSRDIALTVVPLVIFLVAFPLDYKFGGPLRPDIRSLFDRFTTAMFTTAIVSGLSFLSVYFRLARESSIVWDYGQ